MMLQPPLEQARVNWVSQLSKWLGVVCDLERIQSSRYDTAASSVRITQPVTKKTHRHLLTRLPAGALKQAYRAIEGKLAEVNAYINLWLQYQALWDLDPTQLYASLGSDLAKWLQLLGEIREARKTIDTRY
jgi:dynein heavy chain 1